MINELRNCFFFFLRFFALLSTVSIQCIGVSILEQTKIKRKIRREEHDTNELYEV